MVEKNRWSLFFILQILLTSCLLSSCNAEKFKTTDNTYVLVRGKIQQASNDTQPMICRIPTSNESVEQPRCGTSKTIELIFHRTNPDISSLRVTTDLARLVQVQPGWSTAQNRIICSGKNICKEACRLKLTFTPTSKNPESAIYIDYEYMISGEKEPKKNRVSVVYTM